MANYTFNTVSGATELQYAIPDIVIPDSIATASRKEVVMQHVTRIDKTGAGDIFHLSQRAALNFGAYSSDATAPNETALTMTERTFTPVERVVDVVLTRKSLADSAVDINEAIAAEVGIGLAKDRDARLLAIYTEAPASAPTHEIGTQSVPFSFDIIRQIEKLLLTQNAPRIDGGPSKRGFVQIVHPTQYGEYMEDDRFINAGVKGQPVLTQGIREDGWITDVLNTSIYASDQVVSSSGLHSMAISRLAAVAWVFKQIGSPGQGLNEVMIDAVWHADHRAYKVSVTYEAIAGGRKGSSTTTNNWMVDAKS